MSTTVTTAPEVKASGSTATATTGSIVTTPPAPAAVTTPATAAVTPPVTPAQSSPADPAATPAKAEGETKPTEGEAKPAEKAGDKPAGVPEKYDLKLPENSPFNEKYAEKFGEFAKDMGLSNEQAQKLVDRECDAVNSYATQQAEAVQAEVDAWKSQANADKEIGGSNFKVASENSFRAFQEFGTPELGKLLESTGAGNHPEIVRFMHRVGKALANDKIVGDGKGAEKPVSDAELFYGKKA